MNVIHLVCKYCHGNGYIIPKPDTDDICHVETCEHCKGTGEIEKHE